MEQNQMNRNIWDLAAKAGLALGLLSVACLFITQWIGQSGMPAFLNMLVNGIFWLVKFLGSIWLMIHFMKRLAAQDKQISSKETFRLGMISALLSALVVSAFAYANAAFISPDLFAEQMDAVMQQMAPMLDSNSLAQMDKIMQDFPKITFFSNLTYCFIYGTVLSFILSRSIPSRDPFADYKPEEQ